MTSEPDSATPFTALTGGLETEGYRERPRNVEAEQAVLGAVLVNNETLNRVSEIVQPTHFHEPAHQRIYEAALKLVDRGQLASPVTLRHFFEQDQSLAQVGGAQYLARLAGAAVTLYEVEHYARVVQDLALRRDLITIAEEMMHEAHVPDVDDSAGEQIERAEQQLFQLAETGQADRGFIDFAQAVREAIEMADAAYKRDTLLVGVPTGLTDLDQRLGGLHRSDLLILAARPAMGKTALAANIAFHAADAYRTRREADGSVRVDDGAVVAFFSLEMSAEQLATRMLGEQAEVPSEKIRRGALDQNDFNQVVQASQRIAEIPLFIDDTPALTISALRTRAPAAETDPWPGPDRRRLFAAAAPLGPEPDREPSAGDLRDHPGPEGLGQGAGGAGARPLPALPRGGESRGQASAALGLARIGRHRAGRRRGHVPLPRGVLPRAQGTGGGHRRAR